MGRRTSKRSNLLRFQFIILYYTLFSTLFFTSNVFAEKKLTWAESVALAKVGNSDLRSYENNFQAIKELEAGSESGFFPQLSGQIQTSQSSSSSNRSTTSSATLSASQNLFNGFLDLEKRNQAAANTAHAESTLKIQKAKVSHLFITAYNDLKSIEASELLTQEIKKRRKENLRLIELRFQGGRENKGSVLLSEANLKQAQWDHLKTIHNQRTSEINLQQFLGLEPLNLNEKIILADEVPLQEPLNEDLLDFFKLTLSHPQYHQVLALEKAAESMVAQEKSSFYPTLNLTGSLGQQGPDFSSSTETWSTALTLNIPLFSGLRDRSSYKSSLEKYLAATQNRISLFRTLRVSLQEAYFSYIQAVEKLKVDEAFQEAVYLRAEIARKQYNNGLVSFQEWDQIEGDLIQRQKNYLESKKQRVLQESLWRQALGEGVF
ncbi:MAG TPA: TolC family protein [Pseudobdellovibrionaceae bacterium]|nr:TolC family protein [Pseudobdellovibrionaceae bacterium]